MAIIPEMGKNGLLLFINIRYARAKMRLERNEVGIMPTGIKEVM